MPPSSSSERPNRSATRGPTARPMPGRPGGAEQRDAGVVDQRLPDVGAAEQHLAERRPGAPQLGDAPRPASARTPRAVSGVSSDGFQTTGSPQTRATAVFQDHTAAGKLNALMTPDDAERVPGLHQPVAGPLGRHRPAVELARQADREVADVDHLLHLAARLGGDLADLEADQRGEVVLVLGQQLAQPLDEAPRGRGRHRPPLTGRPACAAARPPRPRLAPSAPGDVAGASPLIGETRRDVAGRGREVDTAAARRWRGRGPAGRRPLGIGAGVVVMVLLVSWAGASEARARRC